MRSWLKPDTTKEMIIPDKAWLAGFFDGEGSIGIYKSSGRKGKYKNWNLCIGNTSWIAVRYCQKISGVGSIVEKKIGKKPKHYKRQWLWNVQSQRNIISVLKQILPYLKIKKMKVRKFLLIWKDI